MGVLFWYTKEWLYRGTETPTSVAGVMTGNGNALGACWALTSLAWMSAICTPQEHHYGLFGPCQVCQETLLRVPTACQGKIWTGMPMMQGRGQHRGSSRHCNDLADDSPQLTCGEHHVPHHTNKSRQTQEIGGGPYLTQTGTKLGVKLRDLGQMRLNGQGLFVFTVGVFLYSACQ